MNLLVWIFIKEKIVYKVSTATDILITFALHLE